MTKNNREHEPEGALGARLERWYAEMTPTSPDRAASAVAAALAGARGEERARRRRVGWLRPAIAAVVAVVAIAVATSPLWRGVESGPASTPTTSGGPSAVVPSTPRATRTAATPSPTSEMDALGGAGVDGAGPIRTGGTWAVSGSALRLTFDGGATWASTSIPASDPSVSFIASTFVLDATHAWTIRSGPGSHTGAQDDYVSLLVYRTVDGGRSWQSTTIPGNFAWEQMTLTFVDASHGFLTGTSGNANTNPTTIWRTSDGGATWTAASTHALAWYVGVSDASTIWSASMGGGAMCAQCGQPLLEVSRDAGSTWSVVRLPGYEGKLSTGSLGLGGSPAFVAPSTAFVFVNESSGDNPSDGGSSRILRTTDGGRTWTTAGSVAYWLNDVFVLDAGHWLADAAAPVSPRIIATDDAGKTWRDRPSDAGKFTYFGTWFTDRVHGGLVVGPGSPGLPSRVLYLTSDGGVTWAPASFGATDGGASPGSGPSDASRSEDLVAGYQNAVSRGDWVLAWSALSAFTQRQLGPLDTFRTQQAAYEQSVEGLGGMTIPGSTPLADSDCTTADAAAACADLRATADVSRARLVVVLYGDAANPSHRQAFVAAPATGGESWRLWLLSQR